MRIAIFGFLLFFLLPHPAYAGSFSDGLLGGFEVVGLETYGYDTNPKDPRIIIAALIQISFILTGILFFFLMLYAGYLWLTAHGEDENVKKSLKILRAAIIGMIVLFTSYAITDFVFYELSRDVGGIYYYRPSAADRFVPDENP